MKNIYERTRDGMDRRRACVDEIGMGEVYKVTLERYDSRHTPVEFSSVFIEKREAALERAVCWVMGVTDEKAS